MVCAVTPTLATLRRTTQMCWSDIHVWISTQLQPTLGFAVGFFFVGLGVCFFFLGLGLGVGFFLVGCRWQTATRISGMTFGAHVSVSTAHAPAEGDIAQSQRQLPQTAAQH